MSTRDKVEKIREFDKDTLERDADGEYILPDDITYAEYLHFTHPELSPQELSEQLAKERRSAWSVRFLLLGIIVVAILVIVFIIAG